MRYLKLKKQIIIFTCLLLIVCVVSSCSNKITRKASASENQINNFLKKNHADIDIKKDNYNNKFSMLDDDIKKNNIILAGEEHSIAENYEVKLSLLKYINQKDKVRYLLAEMGYSSSCYINEYLESGDESKLKLVYNDLLQTASWNKEDYNFWIELRGYNQSIPESQRIKVIGIDIEHQIGTACKYLNSILPNSAPPNEVKTAIEKYTESYNLKNNDEFIKAIKDLQSNIKANPNMYNSYLGSRFFDFAIVVDNIVNSINFYNSNIENSNELRESCIYSNFKRLYEHFPVEKYFGEFGMEHVYQKTPNSSVGDYTRFAAYLNSSDSPVKSKVLSISYGYENCNYMTSGQHYGESKADSVISDINILDRYSKTDVTLFKLNGNKSPLNNKTYFVRDFNGGCTTDYFQYIILIKNSKATVPLGNI